MVLRPLMIPAVLLLGAGCAVSMTPEQKLSHEIFVEAAYQCESRFKTIHVDQIDRDGGVKMHADADSRMEYQPFLACYRDGVTARADARRKAGLSVPEGLMREFDVELD